MSHISFHLIPKPVEDESLWEQYARRMRPVRLRSLKKNPECFISKYESEAAQPMDFWIGRLKEATAYTIVVVRTAGEKHLEDPNVLLREDVEWVGFNVCLDLHAMTKDVIEREGSDQSQRQSDWYMAAVYIDEAARGAGAGKKLIQFSIDVMREVDHKAGRTESTCITSAMRGNYRALMLYKKLGYVVTNANATEEKEGTTYDITELKLQL